MSRYTSEIASKNIGNIYDMILIAVIRAKEIKKGIFSTSGNNNLATVSALIEIEKRLIGREYLKKLKNVRNTKRK
jgi:DNA-directed RNA polymerase subunit K/omega